MSAEAELCPMSASSMLRRSPFASVWSVLARRRANRFASVVEDGSSRPACPFCQGNERLTEPESFALRDPGTTNDSPGWQVRVVPNKYPALTACPSPVGDAREPYEQLPAFGLHEVIVETPDHVTAFDTLSVSQVEAVLRVYRARLRTLSTMADMRSVLIFRNEGSASGASQEHVHSQLLALPILPPEVKSEIRAAARYLRRTQECLTCAMLSRELQHRRRLVSSARGYAVVTSFAPRFSYELSIVPLAHSHDFSASDDGDLPGLARTLLEVLGALRTLIGPFPFNLNLQTTPVHPRAGWDAALHWRIDILPRISHASGLSLGSGVWIVAVPPEDAAAALRTVLGA
jgi:UDPglucose--hexose-1-phosphate uridylyltransferase